MGQKAYGNSLFLFSFAGNLQLSEIQFMLKITLDLIYRFIGKQGSEQEAHESRGPVSPDFLR